MIKILFICHGNICRSPMAEFIFKDMVEKRNLTNLFEIESAATSTEEIYRGIGNKIYPPAQEELHRHDIGSTVYTDFTKKRARQLTKKDYMYYDYLLCADAANVRNAKRIVGGDVQGKINLLLSFATDEKRHGDSIADPWYTGDFKTTYADIEETLDGFLNYCMKIIN